LRNLNPISVPNPQWHSVCGKLAGEFRNRHYWPEPMVILSFAGAAPAPCVARVICQRDSQCQALSQIDQMSDARARAHCPQKVIVWSNQVHHRAPSLIQLKRKNER